MCLRGYLDPQKNYFPTRATAATRLSQRLLVSLAALLCPGLMDSDETLTPPADATETSTRLRAASTPLSQLSRLAHCAGKVSSGSAHARRKLAAARCGMNVLSGSERHGGPGRRRLSSLCYRAARLGPGRAAELLLLVVAVGRGRHELRDALDLVRPEVVPAQQAHVHVTIRYLLTVCSTIQPVDELLLVRPTIRIH